MELFISLVPSAVTLAIAIILLMERVAQRRKARKQEDEKQEDAVTLGVQVLLSDRIKHLAKSYIYAKEISLHDRESLGHMHDVYHLLGGNGDLDDLMDMVRKLPLKTTR